MTSVGKRHLQIGTVIGVMIIAAAAGFVVFYWLPHREEVETVRAIAAEPQGTATFRMLLEDPERYVGMALTLEGVIDIIFSDEAGDPTDTTTPPGTSLPNDVEFKRAAYYWFQHQWEGPYPGQPDSVTLSFVEPIPDHVQPGNTVRVVCRIAGEASTGFLESTLDVDLCRDLTVIDNSTSPWSDALRAASERFRNLARASVAAIGESRRPQFDAGEARLLDAVAYCDGYSTPVGRQTKETFLGPTVDVISTLEDLWVREGLIVRNLVSDSGEITKAQGILLSGVIESVGAISVSIAGERFVLAYETECL